MDTILAKFHMKITKILETIPNTTEYIKLKNKLSIDEKSALLKIKAYQAVSRCRLKKRGTSENDISIDTTDNTTKGDENNITMVNNDNDYNDLINNNTDNSYMSENISNNNTDKSQSDSHNNIRISVDDELSLIHISEPTRPL